MIESAYKKHRTTRKTAAALRITHSMLMRKLTKYEIQKESTSRKKKRACEASSPGSLLLIKSSFDPLEGIKNW
ncbi:hypothetical protein [Brevibacillus sp. SIMBA_040]|uniref:hypothetical protein n=1 Tax=unclassified Brevibacillus TaxID=2684853 RepID=UPI003978114C